MKIEEIARRIGFNHEKDHVAATFLAKQLENTTVPALETSIDQIIGDSLNRKLSFVTGGALGLKDDFDKVSSIADVFKDKIAFIAANGTCKFLLDKKIIPLAVITDLDGGLDNIIAAGREGSIIVLLAHGDNMPLVREFFARIENYNNRNINYIPTVQISGSNSPAVMLDGFTDGDRAVLLAARNAARVVLLGFDYSGFIGPFSKQGISAEGVNPGEIKSKKLSIASEIIDDCAVKNPTKIWTVNQASMTANVKIISLSDIELFLRTSCG
ncbi:MAG: 6-hydroxymethylpterin diphosphokinase MptE-like protein [Candidatus Hodarchaeales archaeon]